jgi:uncharacterized membrane protein YoaK (UPF0700 family)
MFDLSIVSTYLAPSIVLICLCVGYVVKNLIPAEQVNKFIPTIVAILGVICAIIAAATTGQVITLDTVVTGLMSGLTSTGLYEAFKNLLGSAEKE